MYENILKDYTKRAYQNYQKNRNSEYNVTLLISCITGALSLIDEKMRKMFFENILYFSMKLFILRMLKLKQINNYKIFQLN
jgi:hypothetical protein